MKRYMSFIFLFLLAAPAAAATISFNSGMNCYGNYPIPDTGQTVHYSTAPGDDSDYQPASSQPNYSVFYGGTETSSYTVDNRTGLMWVTNPNDACSGCAGGYVSSGTYTWEAALTKCENLNYAGFSDWRLPDIKELASIVNFNAYNPAVDSAFFFNTYPVAYWSSTTDFMAANRWQINFNLGEMTSANPVNPYSVRCVRGNR